MSSDWELIIMLASSSRSASVVSSRARRDLGNGVFEEGALLLGG